MRLDATDLRFVTQEEFKVLSAVETGSRNHEVVPTPLIAELSSIRSGIVTKCLSSLSKRKLVARVQGAKYDGYRLTYGGLDYLALRTFSRRKPATVLGVGTKIGVGKESDIQLVKDEAGKERVMKMHRLGRISFRAIKEKRDYLGKRKSASWMYMSRLAAQKEFEFMKVLYRSGFPVPIPIDQARHCIVMSLIDAFPLRQVDDVPDPATLYVTLMALLLRLAHCGLIHGDYNEFNILIHRKTGEPTLIDFPQMVSTRHPNAEFFFDRDVECIKRFFRRRFRFEATSWPRWRDVLAGPSEPFNGPLLDNEDRGESSTSMGYPKLDEEVEASGWNSKHQSPLDEYFASVADLPEGDWNEEDEDDDESDLEEDEEQGDEEAMGEENQDDKIEGRSADHTIPLDDETERVDRTAARLEQIRLNRALGNDESDFGVLNGDQNLEHSGSDNSTQSDDESEDEEEDSAAAVPLAQGDKLRRTRHSQEKISERLEKEFKGSRNEGKADGRVKAGKAKGHKWKTNEKYIVGKNSGW